VLFLVGGGVWWVFLWGVGGVWVFDSVLVLRGVGGLFWPVVWSLLLGTPPLSGSLTVLSIKLKRYGFSLRVLTGR